MEEGNDNPQPQTDFSPQRTKVSFPGGKNERKSKKGLIFIILVVLALLGIAGWYLFSKNKTSDSISNITPSASITEATSTPTEEPVDKSEIQIEILNGTSISGEASKLKTTLAELGYTNIEVGNASSSDYVTTEVTFKSSVPDEVQDEITDELESIYAEVDVNKASIGEKDVQIIIGYRKGFTPAPKVTSGPTKVPIPTTSTQSATVTPTRTPTPSPTP